MSANLKWVDESEHGRVGEARLLCYGSGSKDLEKFRGSLRDNPRVHSGDCLLAEKNGRLIGTATSLSMRMWLRGGGVVPCQGVAWVGTVKTSRRSGNASAGQPGVATQIMRATLDRARERGEVISALMPFRGSFYEHFGYGIVERRAAWTVPVSIFPHGSFDGIRYYEPGDLDALSACRQRIAERGHCDMERPRDVWAWYVKEFDDAMIAVDRPDDAGPIRGWMTLEHVHEPDGSDTMRVIESGYEDVDTLKRQLHFLASLRDQYSRAIITVPADFQLNRLLREPQITHRDNKNHPTPEVRPYTRMQIRVLDHKRFIESVKMPEDVRGRIAVTVREAEGHASQLWIEIANGRASVTSTQGEAQFECRDTTWAAVVTGDLPASEAVRLGLARGEEANATALLDAFARGPAPFTHEYF
jgi:predicted acetyltransferase